MRQFTLLFVITSCGHLTLTAEDWPHWRGPGRSDVSSESSGWDEGNWNGLKPSWKIQVAEGSSSPLVIGDRLVTLGWRDGNDILSCHNAKTGVELWQQSYSAPRYGRKATGDQGLFSGPTSTPEFDAKTGLLFTLSADGDLRAWDLSKNGTLVWKLNLYEKYDVPRRPKVGRSGLRDYGYTTAPLTLGNELIVEVGATQGTLIAFDLKTGKERWRSAKTSPPGHTGGPTPITVDGVPCVAVHSFDGLLVVRTDAEHAGETVAEVPWITAYANNVASATVHNNSIIITSSYTQHRISRYDISLKGGAKKIWERKEASKVCSPIIVDGHVYWSWRKTHCLKFDNGKTVWNGGAIGDPGSLIATADQRLILWTNRGDLKLIEGVQHSPKEYRELASIHKLGKDDAWPHAVFANGRLYCKDRSGILICFELI